MYMGKNPANVVYSRYVYFDSEVALQFENKISKCMEGQTYIRVAHPPQNGMGYCPRSPFSYPQRRLTKSAVMMLTHKLHLEVQLNMQPLPQVTTQLAGYRLLIPDN